VGTKGEGDLTGMFLTAAAVAAGCIFYLAVEVPISRRLHKSSLPLLKPIRPVEKGGDNVDTLL
jgi:hypothetical protein